LLGSGSWLVAPWIGDRHPDHEACGQAALALGGEALAMVKPQFELGRARVGRGVVRDPADRREAIITVAVAARELGLPIRGVASSGLPGPKGNRETFVWCGGEGAEVEDLEAAVLEIEGDA
jgi:23S rRNA (cytidine1920-2'-O)/16S rRNA (cytidine1409-2'-O)-methyltransferase